MCVLLSSDQSAAEQLIGQGLRDSQRQWSKLVSQQISSKNAHNRVNDNAALSVFPAVKVKFGERELAYTGKPAAEYRPHKSRVSSDRE